MKGFGAARGQREALFPSMQWIMGYICWVNDIFVVHGAWWDI